MAPNHHSFSSLSSVFVMFCHITWPPACCRLKQDHHLLATDSSLASTFSLFWWQTLDQNCPVLIAVPHCMPGCDNISFVRNMPSHILRFQHQDTKSQCCHCCFTASLNCRLWTIHPDNFRPFLMQKPSRYLSQKQTFWQRAFSFIGLKQWNSLPYDIHRSPSESSFTQALKNPHDWTFIFYHFHLLTFRLWVQLQSSYSMILALCAVSRLCCMHFSYHRHKTCSFVLVDANC